MSDKGRGITGGGQRTRRAVLGPIPLDHDGAICDTIQRGGATTQSDDREGRADGRAGQGDSELAAGARPDGKGKREEKGTGHAKDVPLDRAKRSCWVFHGCNNEAMSIIAEVNVKASQRREMDAMLMFAAGKDPAEVKRHVQRTDYTLGKLMERAIQAWRHDKEFRQAYEQGVQRIREYGHHFSIA